MLQTVCLSIMPIHRFGIWQINSICPQVCYGSNKAEECFHVWYCSVHIKHQTDPLEGTGLRANSAKIKPGEEKTNQTGIARRDLVMRGYWENKSCPCCACNVFLAQTKQRQYFGHVAEKSQTFLLVWEWNPAPLAAGRAGSSHTRPLCSLEHRAKLCPGSKHVWGKRQEAALCQSTWPEQACAAQPLGLPDPPCPWDGLQSPLCPWDRLHCPLCPERKARRGPSSWHHPCLHCSQQAQRAAEGMGEPLPLQGYCKDSPCQVLL